MANPGAKSRGYAVFLAFDMRLILAAFGFVLMAAISQAALGQTANLEVSATVDASCTLTGATLAFGTYTATASGPTESNADISYNCTPGMNITLSLDGGGGGDVQNRAMAGPAGASLPYQLYKDDSGAAVWGVGATDGLTVPDTPGGQQSVTVYGQIPAGQQAAAGAYADTVLITLAVQ